MKQPVSGIRLGIPRAPFFDQVDEETMKAVEAAIGVLSKLTKTTVECHLPSTAGFDNTVIPWCSSESRYGNQEHERYRRTALFRESD